MKIITCDNCGKEGIDSYIGDLCEPCNDMYRKEREKIEATINILEYELKKKFHIRI